MQGDQGNQNRPFKQECFYEYGLPKNAISTWVKNKDKYLQSLEARGTGKFKKLRESDFDKLDHVVVCWFISKRIFL